MTFWVAGAAVVGAIGGAVISSKSTDNAVETQANSTAAGIGEQRRQFDQIRTDQAPYRDAGAKALGEFAVGNDTPLNPGSVQMDPGYEFARKQGQQGIDRKTAAAGGRISGAALKRASEYNTDYATTGYSTAYNRVNQARTDRLNRLAALAGIGQTATQQTGQAGQNAGNAIANMTTAQGNASAAGQIAQGNIWAGAGNQIAALYGRNSSAPTQTYNPAAYSAPGGGDYYYGVGQNYGV